ncbi:MAG: hypothetical protein GXO25_05945 [Euryarchaeota archaeon]|nr:hypothetical protein [Euryarchaeota archaeon]
MNNDYDEIKAGVRKLLDGAEDIMVMSEDPVEVAAMLEIQRHADAILEMVAKMEKKEGGY